MQSEQKKSDHPALVVVTATTMEMRAAFPMYAQRLPREHGWVSVEANPGALILMVTGVGPINAGIALGHLLGVLGRPCGVLNLGVAGAFSLEAQPLGKPVLVAEEIWPEYGLLTASGLDPMGIGLALGLINGSPVWDRLQLEPKMNAEQMGLNIAGLAEVVSLTVAGVSGTNQRAATLRQRYAADVENMEGFALAWACRRLKTPFVQVRTISNLVGSRDAKHWDLQGAKVRLGKVSQTILKELHA